MNWTIDYLKKDGIIHAQMSGIVTWDENKKMAEEVFSFGCSKGAHRYLLEHPQIELNLTVLQIDSLPNLLKELGLRTEDKLAVLIDPTSDYDEELKFFEKVSRLASLQVRYFTDFEKAISWLKSNQPNKTNLRISSTGGGAKLKEAAD